MTFRKQKPCKKKKKRDHSLVALHWQISLLCVQDFYQICLRVTSSCHSIQARLLPEGKNLYNAVRQFEWKIFQKYYSYRFAYIYRVNPDNLTTSTRNNHNCEALLRFADRLQ